MSIENYTIQKFYPKPNSNGYGIVNAYRRFSILHEIPNFNSVLDVGSGACLLRDWLQTEQFKCVYEAVDIREEALQLCKCKTHTAIPNSKFDLVCLFGTVTYNIDNDIEKNKKILEQLIKDSKSVCQKYLVVTVFDDDFHVKRDIFVYYKKEELKEILEKTGFKIIDIKQNSYYDQHELIAICEV